MSKPVNIKEREGKIFETKQSGNLKVIKYYSSTKVLVEFERDKTSRYTTWGNILLGNVRNHNNYDSHKRENKKLTIAKQFVSDFWESQGDKYFFGNVWGNHIDVMVLATMELLTTRYQMDNFKLFNVAKTLGIEINETLLHDAMYDIEITRQIYYLLQNKQKAKVEENLGNQFMPQSTAQINTAKINPSSIKEGKNNYKILSYNDAMPFGKYKGKTIQEIFEDDLKYLDWVSKNTDVEFDTEVAEDIIKFIELESKPKAKTYVRNQSNVDYMLESLDANYPF